LEQVGKYKILQKTNKNPKALSTILVERAFFYVVKSVVKN